MNDLKVVDVIRRLIQEHGLNFAGIRALFAQFPCWKIKSCSEAERKQCDRFPVGLSPCWRLGGTGCGATAEECKACPVYAYVERSIFPATDSEDSK